MFFTIKSDWYWQKLDLEVKKHLPWNHIRNGNTYFFFQLDIFALNPPLNQSKLRKTKWNGGKHWAVFFPPQTQTCLLTVNGTLCASFLVFKWVSECKQRQDGVLSSNNRALQGILPKRWIHLGYWMLQETLPQTKVVRLSGFMHTGAVFSSLLTGPLTLLWGNAAP